MDACGLLISISFVAGFPFTSSNITVTLILSSIKSLTRLALCTGTATVLTGTKGLVVDTVVIVETVTLTNSGEGLEIFELNALTDDSVGNNNVGLVGEDIGNLVFVVVIGAFVGFSVELGGFFFVVTVGVLFVVTCGFFVVLVSLVGLFVGF